MKANRAINATLNKVLGIELIVINQTFLHARMLGNWGFHALGKCEYEASIKAMKEADELIERILFLEGLPNLQDLGKLMIGQDVPEILKSDLSLFMMLSAQLLESILFCEKDGDYVSREELNKILEKTEHHIDFLEAQLDLVGKMALPNYLQSAAGEIKN